ncbi:hypothetical protein BASA50_002650 [Batrachochytrium salamandrivorans]|uniref:TPX2 C-terminal domain-containing protein n=1 Tax=Batrachochytrium salamandrivorans TaxID=1357716 RepID=A0ABQ8FKN2_9FUNG|nr:hypothetical protein BASA50_002650 [Batrachochytrium salamandrivorans]KAH9257162.1 hypothetical protein BASA81_004712 [Batrachochytrium salamandrivorans]
MGIDELLSTAADQIHVAATPRINNSHVDRDINNEYSTVDVRVNITTTETNDDKESTEVVENVGINTHIIRNDDPNCSSDELYEFNAPKFHDFTAAPENNDDTDRWFDVREGTPDINSDAEGDDIDSSKCTTACQPIVEPSPVAKVSLPLIEEEASLSDLHCTLASPRSAELNPEPQLNLSATASSTKQPLDSPDECPVTLDKPLSLYSSEEIHSITDSIDPVVPVVEPLTASLAEKAVVEPHLTKVENVSSAAPQTLPSSEDSDTTSLGVSFVWSATASSTSPVDELNCASDQTKATKTRAYDHKSAPRVKGRASSSNEPGYLRETHSMTLRRSSAKPSTGGVMKKRTAKKNPMDLTIPKPFNLRSQGSKLAGNSSSVAPSSPYVSLAVKVQKFQSKTPDRFRTRAVKLPLRKRDFTKLTQPKSPLLTTKYRIKPSKHIPTKGELEEEELQNYEKFKAKPINRRILAAKNPLGVPSVQKIALTIPMSPAISKPKPVKQRLLSPEKIIKANPIPDLDHPFAPKLVHRRIEPVEFSLPGDEISRRKNRDFLDAVQQENMELEVARHFQAQPIISKKPRAPPSVQIPALTQPRPFELKTSARGERHKAVLQERLVEEIQESENQRQFHANPIPDTNPFTTKKSNHPLTEIKPMILHTDIRAEERSLFEDQKRRREEEEANMLSVKETLRKEREFQEIQNLRRAQTHRAQPVRHFSGVYIHPSTRKLTEPQSPAIGNHRRSARENLSSSMSISHSVFDEHQHPTHFDD